MGRNFAWSSGAWKPPTTRKSYVGAGAISWEGRALPCGNIFATLDSFY
jgi:hypothetical protein